MFKRRSAAEWEKGLCDAGFVDVEVEERTVATRYASVEEAEAAPGGRLAPDSSRARPSRGRRALGSPRRRK